MNSEFVVHEMYELVDKSGFASALAMNGRTEILWVIDYISKLGNTIFPLIVDESGTAKSVKFGDATVSSKINLGKEYAKFFKNIDMSYVPHESGKPMPTLNLTADAHSFWETYFCNLNSNYKASETA